MKEVMLGYIVWNEKDDKPYRPTLGSDWRTHKAPPRIYQTEKMATRVGYGAPVKAVYVKVENDIL